MVVYCNQEPEFTQLQLFHSSGWQQTDAERQNMFFLCRSGKYLIWSYALYCVELQFTHAYRTNLVANLLLSHYRAANHRPIADFG
jgi:hypothetical protein